MSILTRLFSRRQAAAPTPPTPPTPPVRRTSMDRQCRRDRVQQATYDATEEKGQRATGFLDTRSEDRVLDRGRRTKLVTSTRDLRRNMPTLAWAIGCHLDYVSRFTFSARTAIPGLNAVLEALMTKWARPQNFDVRGRMSLSRMIRLLEAHRTVDGDAFLLLLQDGRVQPIEGDRIGNPTGYDPLDESMVQGVKLAPEGSAVAYSLCRRMWGGGFVFDRWLSAHNVLHLAQIDRFDQVRGISPIASALNTFRDLYEASTYALLKMKAAAAVAYAFYREAAETVAPTSGEGEGQDESPYQIDFGRGPFSVDLEPGDKMETIESHTPSTEFQSYAKLATMTGLKCLNLPFSFFSEDFTTYSGARQALLQYERSTRARRNDLQDVLDPLTRWRVALWILDGELTLPGGYTAANLPFEWVPEALPWIAPLDETQSDLQRIAAGITSRRRVCRKNSEDFEEIVAENAADDALLKANNLSTALPGVASQPAVSPDTPSAPPAKGK